MDLPIKHYGIDQPTETVQGDEYTEEALIIPNSKQSGKCLVTIYLSKQPKGTLCSQLTELSTDKMLKTLFSNIRKLANLSTYLC